MHFVMYYIILSPNKNSGDLFENVRKRRIGGEIAKTRISTDFYSDI